jgi:hypothetical protein
MNRLKLLLPILGFVIFTFGACKKDKNPVDDGYTYYEVGFKSTTADWRDSSFIVRTKSQQLIQQIETQLTLPVAQRQIVSGLLVAGSGGYNKNSSHEFKWHFKEDDWSLVDVTIEIYDGRPFTDIDQNLSYWLNTVKRYGSWGSYIKRKLPASH